MVYPLAVSPLCCLLPLTSPFLTPFSCDHRYSSTCKSVDPLPRPPVSTGISGLVPAVTSLLLPTARATSWSSSNRPAMHRPPSASPPPIASANRLKPNAAHAASLFSSSPSSSSPSPSSSPSSSASASTSSSLTLLPSTHSLFSSPQPNFSAPFVSTPPHSLGATLFLSPAPVAMTTGHQAACPCPVVGYSGRAGEPDAVADWSSRFSSAEVPKVEVETKTSLVLGQTDGCRLLDSLALAPRLDSVPGWTSRVSEAPIRLGAPASVLTPGRSGDASANKTWSPGKRGDDLTLLSHQPTRSSFRRPDLLAGLSTTVGVTSTADEPFSAPHQRINDPAKLVIERREKSRLAAQLRRDKENRALSRLHSSLPVNFAAILSPRVSCFHNLLGGPTSLSEALQTLEPVDVAVTGSGAGNGRFFSSDDWFMRTLKSARVKPEEAGVTDAEAAVDDVKTRRTESDYADERRQEVERGYTKAMVGTTLTLSGSGNDIREEEQSLAPPPCLVAYGQGLEKSVTIRLAANSLYLFSYIYPDMFSASTPKGEFFEDRQY
ncbi:unnamed protein product [Protopolystoma xenopodis]|uniref:Uncharacterized protein n=1 Tax=Protopolystoma xenopodis TaxID=117903 RepID=A0A3S5A1S1_9PLAT|nr:unnamed protein product [Protopolystoma xenopodis]